MDQMRQEQQTQTPPAATSALLRMEHISKIISGRKSPG